jgi:probable addiction module antidote protein
MNPSAAEKLGIKPFDAAEYLKTEEDYAQYLCIVLSENDPSTLALALGTIARARGMTAVAKDAGLTREALYKSLSLQGNPSFATVQKVMNALGLQLSVQPIGATHC